MLPTHVFEIRNTFEWQELNTLIFYYFSNVCRPAGCGAYRYLFNIYISNSGGGANCSISGLTRARKEIVNMVIKPSMIITGRWAATIILAVVRKPVSDRARAKPMSREVRKTERNPPINPAADRYLGLFSQGRNR